MPRRIACVKPMRGTARALGLAVLCASSCAAPSRSVASSPLGTVVRELDPHVASVLEAKDGSFWFASREHGLFHHDGAQLRRYTVADGLPSDHISGVQQDRGGDIIVLCDSAAMVRFDGFGFRAVPTRVGDDAMWRLDERDLWFSAGQNSGGAYRFDGEASHVLKFPTTTAGDEHYVQVPRDKFPNAKYTPYDIYTVFHDRRGCLWFGTAGLGVCRYDGRSLAWADKTEIGFPANDGFGVRGIVEDSDGLFWFSLTGTRFRVRADLGPGKPGVARAPAGAPVLATLGLQSQPGLSPNDPIEAFVSAHRDRRGDLWFATLGDGVYRSDGTGVEHFPVTNARGESVWIYSMYRDSHDGLWVCTQGAGVQRLDGKAFRSFGALPEQQPSAQ